MISGLLGAFNLKAAKSCRDGPYGFPCLWNEWTKLFSADSMIVTKQELELWQQVKDRWREVERNVNEHYGLN